MMLAGKIAMITGAAQGIGAQLALGLARQGAAVAIADVIDGEPAARAVQDAGGRAIAGKVDICDDAALAAFVARIEEELGGLDIVVNNAALFGTLAPTPMMELSIEEWDRVMRVNVRGVWQCAKAALPAMGRRGGGSIVNIATNRVFRGFPNLLHYDASKGAVLAMTKAMAAELGPQNIRVNAVAPGLTLSENVLAKDGIAEREKAVVAGPGAAPLAAARGSGRRRMLFRKRGQRLRHGSVADRRWRRDHAVTVKVWEERS
jgi:NAD(P)-dependent dehydrogenase (short-subunit alcohol dehydrogenase family)